MSTGTPNPRAWGVLIEWKAEVRGFGFRSCIRLQSIVDCFSKQGTILRFRWWKTDNDGPFRSSVQCDVIHGSNSSEHSLIPIVSRSQIICAGPQNDDIHFRSTSKLVCKTIPAGATTGGFSQLQSSPFTESQMSHNSIPTCRRIATKQILELWCIGMQRICPTSLARRPCISITKDALGAFQNTPNDGCQRLPYNIVPNISRMKTIGP
mmetsp:Transcript_29118/g.42881  ORF Transcript_29118/g.42881 Transcript_29118/m.42881 type:complete len:208 (-) Transcript_29118:514-1137(-)